MWRKPSSIDTPHTRFPDTRDELNDVWEEPHKQQRHPEHEYGGDYEQERVGENVALFSQNDDLPLVLQQPVAIERQRQQENVYEEALPPRSAQFARGFLLESDDTVPCRCGRGHQRRADRERNGG